MIPTVIAVHINDESAFVFFTAGYRVRHSDCNHTSKCKLIALFFDVE
jgi:hypothetical protein